VVTPLVLNGRVLVDGALLNPLPIIPTISSHAVMVVAVNLSGEDDRRHRISAADLKSALESDSATDEWVEKIREKASRWFDWDALKTFTARRDRAAGDESSTEDKLGEALARKQAEARRDAEKQAPEKKTAEKKSEDHETIDWDKLGIGKFDVMNLTIETMQSALSQYKLAGYPPDLLVNVPKNASRSYDYHRAPELIQLGRERMSAALDRYEEDMNSSGPMAL
jgi:NTE family protein